MKDLAPFTRGLIDAGLHAEGPTQAELERGRARLGRYLASTAAVAGISGSTALAAAKSGGGFSLKAFLANKLTLSVLAWAATGAGIGVAVSAPLIGLNRETPATREARDLDKPALPSLAATVEASSAESVAPAAPAAPVDREPPSRRTTNAWAASPPPPKPPAPDVMPPASAQTPSLSAEMKALAEAHDALREGRGAEALAVLDRQSGSSTDTRALLDERAAVRILALCSLGRGDEARGLGAALLARSPNSPVAARIRASCAAQPKK